MTKAVLRWVIPLAALLLLGPVAGWLTYSLRAPDGGPETSLLLSNSPVMGLLAGVGVFALAAVGGCISARMFGGAAGLFAAGLVLAWGAWGLGRIDQIVRRAGNGSTMWVLSIEGVFVGVLGVLAAVAILRAGRHGKHLEEPEPMFSRASLVALGLGALGAAAAAWIVAREPLKGQMFAAGACAGIVAAIVGHLSSARSPASVFVAAVAVLAAVSPALSTLVNLVPRASGGSSLAILPSSAQVVSAVRAGTMLPLARPLPLDWLAGAFIGVPMGLSWAGAMVEKHAVEPA